jgi:flavin reductase (DIM6/NTAB) family NADH-FMN oxidoreductase RutF
MRRVPSPVVVITAPDPLSDAPGRGITIGSFASVALDPPLVSFNVARDASMHRIMKSGVRYVVHVLGEGQAHLAKRFAEPGRTGHEQFDGVPHRVDDAGSPILESVGLALHCVPHDETEVADKTLFIGRVVQVDEDDDDGAVLYYRQGYRGVGRELPSSLLSPVKRASNDSS